MHPKFTDAMYCIRDDDLHDSMELKGQVHPQQIWKEHSIILFKVSSLPDNTNNILDDAPDSIFDDSCSTIGPQKQMRKKVMFLVADLMRWLPYSSISDIHLCLIPQATLKTSHLTAWTSIAGAPLKHIKRWNSFKSAIYVPQKPSETSFLIVQKLVTAGTLTTDINWN